MTYQEVASIMERARALGVTELEWNGMKIKFSYKKHGSQPKSPAPNLEQHLNEIPKPESSFVPETKPEELVKPLSVLDQMSDEEILYYATPYYDELQAQKAEHARKLAEETTSN